MVVAMVLAVVLDVSACCKLVGLLEPYRGHRQGKSGHHAALPEPPEALHGGALFFQAELPHFVPQPWVTKSFGSQYLLSTGEPRNVFHFVDSVIRDLGYAVISVCLHITTHSEVWSGLVGLVPISRTIVLRSPTEPKMAAAN
uniref:Putative secreted protein n=1 Tax=Ixodes ricinus TaxID=34613 RepID=A0A6B0UTF7_IXORI